MKLRELYEDTDTDMGDFIISQFEAGQLTYAQAKEKLLQSDLGVWIHELNMAAELIKDSGKTLH